MYRFHTLGKIIRSTKRLVLLSMVVTVALAQFSNAPASAGSFCASGKPGEYQCGFATKESAGQWNWSRIFHTPGMTYAGLTYYKFGPDGAPPATGYTNYWTLLKIPDNPPYRGYAINYDAGKPAPPKNFTVAPSNPPPPIIANPGPAPTNQCNKPIGGNPINFAIGDKFQVETDYVGNSGLTFTRYYHSSMFAESSHTGKQWRHNFDRAISTFDDTVSHVAYVTRGDGQQYPFYLQNGSWKPDGDIADTLIQLTDASGNRTGWQLSTSAEEIETYDVTGKLTSIELRTGSLIAFDYSDATTPISIAPAPGLLIRVTDPFGRQLNFTYDSGSRVKQMTDPDGNVFVYSYDTDENLISVSYPDLTPNDSLDNPKRIYLYNEQAFTSNTPLPQALTGIVDENNQRFATYNYDAQGRAISSEHAGGVDKTSIIYNGNNSSTVVDPLGTARTYGLQTINDVTKVASMTEPCPSCGGTAATQMGYDANGNVTSKTDFNGNRTNYTYDLTRNLETSLTEGLTSAGAPTPQTRTINTEWHSAWRMVSRMAEPKRISTYVYSGDNGISCGAVGVLCSKRVQETSDANGSQGFAAGLVGLPRVWTYTYNSFGQMLTSDGPRSDVSDVSTMTYYTSNDSAGNYRIGDLASVTNALGHNTQITSYDAHGKPKTVIDANGLTTTIDYFPRGWIKSRNVGGLITNYEYDGIGQMIKVTLPDGSFITYSYDAAHRMTGMQDSLGNRISYTLDLAGNRTKEEVFNPQGVLTQTRSRVFDTLNRLYQDIGAQNQITQLTYDDNGNLKTAIDPLNHTTTNFYDALNRLIKIVDPNNGQTQYGYNALDQLISVTDPRDVTTQYNYNAFSDLTQQVSPDTGTTTNTYDVAGNLRTQTDAKGQLTSYSYDALNRVTSVAYADGQSVTYTYDQSTNAIGRLKSIQDSAGTIAYAYDQQGRVTGETRTILSVNYVTSYGYDNARRLAQVTYPSGRLINYTLDSLGRINALNSTMATTTDGILNNVAYQPFGPLKSFAFGNGANYQRTFDQDGRLSSYNLGTVTKSLGYDPASRIQSLSNPANASDLKQYGYDMLDRLTNYTAPGITQGFSYDATGNRTSQTQGASSYPYAIDPTSNRLLSAAGPTAKTYTYDANGSPTNDGTNQYVYDARGRLIQTATPSGTNLYRLNALGQRITKSPVIGATVYHYDLSGKLIAESDSFGVMQKEYVYLYDQPVAVYGSVATSQCSATPNEVNGTSFTANNTLERLEGRSGKPGAADWEWGLGYNTQLSGGFTKGEWTWVSGKAYSFTLTYDGLGNGSYQVRDNGVVLLTKTYSGSPGKLLRTGNAIQAWVKTSPNIGIGAKVRLTVNSINGSSLNRTIQTAGNNLDSFDAATFEGQNLTTGFTLNGTVMLTFTGTIPYGSRLNFAVTAGNTACATQSQKQLGYIYSDHLDTPRLITNNQSQAIWSWDSDPFGTTQANENPTNQGTFNFNLRFPGQYYDQETKTHYNYFRDYDPSTGRYLQSDPIGLGAGYNTYSYVYQNPVTWIDADGRLPLALITRSFMIGWRIGQFANPVVQPVLSRIVQAVLPIQQTGTSSVDGDCSSSFRTYLQSEVNRTCKPDPGQCKPGESCSSMRDKCAKHTECAEARKKINNTCFRGGNDGHRFEYNKRKKMADDCKGLIAGGACCGS